MRDYPTPGIEFSPQYDDFGRFTRLTTENASGDGVDFEYPLYDKNGNIMLQIYHHRNQQNPPTNGFNYDDLNRLTNASYGMFSNGAEHFYYDLLGNRTSTTDDRYFGSPCTYTPSTQNNNEYDYICGTAVLYDAAGNLKQDKNGYTYRYDYENRLVEIRKTNDTITIATFEYDALGRRIEKVVIGSTTTTTRFYYDDQRIVLQTESNGQTQPDRTFVYGNYIDKVLVMSVIPAQGAIQDYYYAHDHLYSPAVLFAYDSQQQSWLPCERYEYDVYGQMRRLNPDFTAFSGTEAGNPYYFTGRELDSFDTNALKLMYYRARSYDPHTGRFLQRDPMQYVDGLNMFEYVKSSPIRHIDPFGLLTIRSESADHIVIINVNETPMDRISIQSQTATGTWSDYTFIPQFTRESFWVKGAERLWSSGKCVIEHVEGIAKEEAVKRDMPYKSLEVVLNFEDIPELTIVNTLLNVVSFKCSGATACSLAISQLPNIKLRGLPIITEGKGGKWTQAWERYYDTGREKRKILEELNVSKSCCKREWVYQSKEKPAFHGWRPFYQVGITTPGPVPNIQ